MKATGAFIQGYMVINALSADHKGVLHPPMLPLIRHFCGDDAMALFPRGSRGVLLIPLSNHS